MTSLRIKNITRLTSFILVVGFFYACTPFQKTANQQVVDENKSEESALSLINSELEENPENAELYYEKATILGALAEEETAGERIDLYMQFAESIQKSYELSQNQPLSAKIDSLSNNYWNLEFNAAMQSFESGSKLGFYEEALTHGANLLVLNPNEAKGYKLLSRLYYQKGDIDAAISILNEARSKTENLNIIFEDLGFLYLETGKAEESAYYYSMANTDGINDKNVAFGLANAYIAANELENAVDILKQLNTKYPHDTQIMVVYGTQLYTKIEQLFSDLNTAYQNSDSSQAESKLNDIRDLVKVTSRILNEAHDRDQDNVEYLETLAVFHSNIASQYLNLIPNSFKTDTKELDRKAKESIDAAIGYYEKLADLSAYNSEVADKISTLKELK